MGLFGNKGQSKDERKAAIDRYKKAKAALDAYYERELAKAGARGAKYIDVVSAEYLRLNKAVLDAEKDVPWIRS